MYSLYPNMDYIPRTVTPRFQVTSQAYQNNFQSPLHISSSQQFNLTEEDKIKISFLIESAMKIIDLVYDCKRKKLKNKFKINPYDGSDTEDENNDHDENDDDDELPLEMYIQWINLWNKEFL